MKSHRIGKHDRVVVAWAEYAAGPGWANQPVWVLVRDGDGNYRVECLQPDEQSRDVLTLYGVNAASTAAMTEAVRGVMEAMGTPKEKP